MRKLLVFLLSAFLCIFLVTVPVSAASADKITTSAAALNMMGALQGDGSGSLNLGGTLTRAQFCKIAVVVLGLEKSVSQYAGYTIFPDVPSSGWAAGYVNAAVRSAKIMAGYPNGNFGPDDVINYGQAVTVLMQMLGYTTTDVGARWPDGFISKANEIGLTDGVTLSAADTVTRGNAAVLFVNLLNADMNGSAKTFMSSISGATVINDVFLVSANATSDNGTTGAVKIAGTNNGTYLPVGSVPSELQGVYGSLVLNSAGKALVMVPARSGKTIVSTVESTSASSIKCADGTKITMNTSASFYLNGTPKTYADSWADIAGGMLVSVYYSDSGAAKSVLVADAASQTGNVTVVTGDTYSLPSSAAVYINGNKASTSDIIKYDVVTDTGTGLYAVTRNRVTGRCEDAYPSTVSPSTIKVLGTEFSVLDGIASNLSSFSIGDTLTLLLTSDNKVAGIVAGTALNNVNYGVVTSISSTTASIRLINGVTVSGGLSSGSSDFSAGDLVTVSSWETGYISLTALSGSATASSLNIDNGTLGSLSLSKAIKVYECVGNSAVTEIKLSDILVNTVDTSKIKFYATDTAGNVSLLLLNDVTGDVYTYGFVKTGSVTQISGSLSATNATTSVTNSSGTSAVLVGGTGLSSDTPAGIAATGGGTLAGFTTLTSLTGVSRSSFQQDLDAKLYLKTAGGLILVADNVQVYMKVSQAWTTLAKARSASDNLTVYYDKTPETGGKVRIVIAN